MDKWKKRGGYKTNANVQNGRIKMQPQLQRISYNRTRYI